MTFGSPTTKPPNLDLVEKKRPPKFEAGILKNYAPESRTKTQSRSKRNNKRKDPEGLRLVRSFLDALFKKWAPDTVPEENNLREKRKPPTFEAGMIPW